MRFNINGIDVKDYGYTVEPLAGKDANAAYYRGVNILAGFGIVHWIAAGTALGLYRDGDFIPHDTDIDVHTDELEYCPAIKREFIRHGYHVARELTYFGVPMQTAFIHPDDNIIFDIYYYLDTGKEYLNYNEHGIVALPKDFIAKRLRMEFENGIAGYVPQPIAGYLAHRYGPDWKSPATQKNDWHTECPAFIERYEPPVEKIADLSEITTKDEQDEILDPCTGDSGEDRECPVLQE